MLICYCTMSIKIIIVRVSQSSSALSDCCDVLAMITFPAIHLSSHTALRSPNSSCISNCLWGDRLRCGYNSQYPSSTALICAFCGDEYIYWQSHDDMMLKPNNSKHDIWHLIFAIQGGFYKILLVWVLPRSPLSLSPNSYRAEVTW